MKALITGATGFIGSHLAELLCDRGWSVRALVRATSDTALLERLGVELARGDVRDMNSIAAAIEGREIIFHAAALVGEWGVPQDFFDINVKGMKNLIDAADATGVRRVIDVSTIGVHGLEDLKRETEDCPYRKSGFLYSDTKLEAEQLVWEAHAQGRIVATTIRPAMVWGPRDPAFLTKIIDLLERKKFIYFDGGRHIAGLAHVRNVCDAIIRAAETEAAVGKAFIVTDDCETTYRQIVEKLCDELGLKRPRFGISYSNAKRLAILSEGYYRRINSKKTPMITKMGAACVGKDISFDVSRAKKILGYIPKYRFPESLPEFLNWYRVERKSV
jgi:2-alkyl-3-oxoalkanoate reductase